MNKRQVIAHAKHYLDLLAEGTDPISREPVGEDSAVSRPQMKKCFQYVSAILQEILENGGVVLLDAEDTTGQANAPVSVSVNGNDYELVRRKTRFSMTQAQKQGVFISQIPVTPARFLNTINRGIDTQAMEKLSIKSVNEWMQKSGYFTQMKTRAIVNRTVWMPTPAAKQIGIDEYETRDPNTGEIKRQLMYSRQAQEFVLAHLEEIVEGK